MFQKITFLFAVACGLLLGATSGQEVDCSKRPERLSLKTCCSLPEVITDEIKEKCMEFAPPATSDESKAAKGPRHHGPPHHHPCFMECALNETEIYVNDELNEAKLAEILDDDSDLQSIVVDAFATCVAKSKEYEAHREEWMKNKPPPPAGDIGPKCNPRSGFLFKCVKMEFFKNCPSDRWNDSNECNDLRDHMVNCKPEHGPHGSHGKWRGRSADSSVDN